jgi:hypothetical protein
VGAGEAKLGDILDGDDPLPGRDGGGEDVEQGRLAGPGRAGDGDGDPGRHHGFEQPRRARVEGAPLDQVAELEPSSGEGADGHDRAVGSERWQHRVEPLAAWEAGVDPGA